jgi:hypothetical protein
MHRSQVGRIMRRLTNGLWVRGAAALALGISLSLLSSCGGGGADSGPAYALTIDGGDAQATSTSDAFLAGEGFLPPGSSCPDTGCSGLLPPPVFGVLGSYELYWQNAATGGSGPIALRWICNCGGGAPSWMTTVPVQPGANGITVTMKAGGDSQQASVIVTRQ